MTAKIDVLKCPNSVRMKTKEPVSA